MTLLFDSDLFEKRAAVLEDGKLVEFYREKSCREEVIGNIYKGKILKVMPGLESAFVDIGLDKAAFLNLSDISFEQTGEHVRIGDVLGEGKDILVQVIRDPVRHKGVRLTARISLASCYMVLKPFHPQQYVSSKIHPKVERKRLSSILEEIAPAGMGLIARTNSAGLDKPALLSARDELLSCWRNVKQKALAAKAPELLYEDISLIPRLLREIRQTELEEVITEDIDITPFLPADFPKEKITLYSEDTPLFARYGVEIEAEKVRKPRIKLPSGGYIVIDQTEALTAVDVNTGRFAGSTDLEQTALATNIEAAREIARALRLRDIGGIIIVDFIDMHDPENREKLTAYMSALLAKDRAKAYLVDITPLGLMEITRKRSGGMLAAASMYERCVYCGGKGVVKDNSAVCSDILAELKTIGGKNIGGRFILEVSPAIAGSLNLEAKDALRAVAEKYQLTLDIIVRSTLSKGSYLISSTQNALGV